MLNAEPIFFPDLNKREMRTGKGVRGVVACPPPQSLVPFSYYRLNFYKNMPMACPDKPHV